MGIISDILEDNKERAGAFFSSRPTAFRDEPPISTRPAVECPLCPQGFTDEARLQSHIVSAHRSVQAYVKINGHVVHDTVFIAEAITSLEAVCFGEDLNQIELLIPGRRSCTLALPKNRPTQFLDLIPSQFSGVLDIKLRYGNTERSTKVFCRQTPVIDVEPLDFAVQSFQRPFLTGAQFNPEAFKDELNRMRRDRSKELQFRYLAGFFEYLLGSDLELRSLRQAGTHFECAFGYLRPFATDMAHTVRCILGLKMNWFELLEDCGPGSPFLQAKEFWFRQL